MVIAFLDTVYSDMNDARYEASIVYRIWIVYPLKSSVIFSEAPKAWNKAQHLKKVTVKEKLLRGLT